MDEAELSRRRALGLLGTLVLAACGSAARHGSAAATSIPVSAPPVTSEATTTAAATTVIPGSNKNVTHQVLADGAKGYNGTWSGTWMSDKFGTTGDITATATIDAESRTLTTRIAVTGDLLHDGVQIPPFTVGGSVDSYTYADDGAFTIRKTTPVGDAMIASVGGMGSGQFHLKVVDTPAHPTVASFEATGVANRAGVIPTTMTISFKDGSTASGSCQFRISRT
jgi:hypothetical protein